MNLNNVRVGDRLIYRGHETRHLKPEISYEVWRVFPFGFSIINGGDVYRIHKFDSAPFYLPEATNVQRILDSYETNP